MATVVIVVGCMLLWSLSRGACHRRHCRVHAIVECASSSSSGAGYCGRGHWVHAIVDIAECMPSSSSSSSSARRRRHRRVHAVVVIVESMPSSSSSSSSPCRRCRCRRRVQATTAVVVVCRPSLSSATVRRALARVAVYVINRVSGCDLGAYLG